MINRRRFLSTGMIGAGLAGTSSLTAASVARPEQPASVTNIFEEKWARANLELLGIPKSWQNVRQGLYPFSPERVLVIEKRPWDWEFRDLKNRLLERGYGKDEYFSEEKLDYAIWIMHTLAKCYGVPEYFEKWATNLARRESLGMAMGTADRWGLIHQFQEQGDHRQVRTRNGLVDWWLFLLPGGVDFQSLDGQPTHVLLGHVDANGSPLRECEYLCLATRLACSVKDMAALSQIDRLAAARYLNRQLLEVM